LTSFLTSQQQTLASVGAEPRDPECSGRPFQKQMAKSAGAGGFDVSVVTSRMAQGEEAAFRFFYELYCDRLFRYLIVLTRGNEELARDLLQTTMIKVVRHIKPFHDEQILWCWLTQIARTTFIDAIRQRQRAPHHVAFSPEAISVIEVQPISADASHLEEALEVSLQELDPLEKEMIHQAYFERSPHQIIAAHTDTTSKAVESKLSRIRQKLRKAILRRVKNETNS
jgi:RNA polymerase sigma factor (sigma-70 family)